MKKIFNIYLLLFCLLISINVSAQVQSIRISINGLTCSQCSKSVEMRLKKLSFISKVDMDLQNTEAKISLKKDAKIDLNKVADAVTDAGFSVNTFWVNYQFPSVNYGDQNCISTKDGIFMLINNNTAITQEVIVLGKKFNASKKYQKIPQTLKEITCKGGNIYYLQAP